MKKPESNLNDAEQPCLDSPEGTKEIHDRIEEIIPEPADPESIFEADEPTLESGRQAPNRVDVESLPNILDGSLIEGRIGDFLFTVGNPSSGKSTFQSFMIHRLWSSGAESEYRPLDGKPESDAYLHGWVKNIGNGFFPIRNEKGNVREFCVRFQANKRPPLDLGFIEIAGEDIRSIVPDATRPQQDHLRLHEHLERFLREPGISKRFLFVSDALVNRAIPGKRANVYEEDILFNTLIRYILGEIGVKRLEILFVAAKWDIVRGEYKKSLGSYFKTNFPQTLATCKSSRIKATYMPFSVGEVVNLAGHNGIKEPRITRKDSRYIDPIIGWIYYAFKSRELGTPFEFRISIWQKFLNLFAW